MTIIVQIWLEIWKLKRALSEFYLTSWEWRKLGMHIMNLMFLMNRYWRLQGIKLAVAVFNLFGEINQDMRDTFSPHSPRLGLHLPFVKIHFVLFIMLYLLKNREKGQIWDKGKGEGCKSIMTWFSQRRWSFSFFYSITGRWKEGNPKRCSLCLTGRY